MTESPDPGDGGARPGSEPSETATADVLWRTHEDSHRARAVAALVAACGGDTPDNAADTVYHGGPVITVDDANPTAEAVTVRDGRIVAVGSEAEVVALRGPSTEVVDLGGRTLAPGFVDPHAHVLNFGAQAVGANLLAPPDGEVESIDDLVAKLQEFGEGPDVERTGWIFGLGYDDAVLAEGRHPTRDDLDRVSTEVPVLAVHISGHLSAVNSVGLERIGYTAATDDPVGGVIRRRPGRREPNGVLEELASIPHVLAIINPTDQEDQAYFVERALELAKSFGYTTAQEGRALAVNHETLASYAEQGLFDIDVVSYIDDTAKDLIDGPWHSRDYRNHYRIGGLKITLDGSPQGRTAWRTEPYLLPPEGRGPDYRGYIRRSRMTRSSSPCSVRRTTRIGMFWSTPTGTRQSISCCAPFARRTIRTRSPTADTC